MASESGIGITRPAALPGDSFFKQTQAALKPKALTALETRANDFLSSALSVTESWMKGQLPDDVTKAVRQATSEASASLGLGTGSAARNLTIRDLGLTSLDLQERGVKYGSSLADQIEKTRQFNRTYDLEVQNVLRNAKALDLDTYRITNELSLRADELAIRQAQGLAELGFQYENLAVQTETNSTNTQIELWRSILASDPATSSYTTEDRSNARQNLVAAGAL